MSSSIIFFIKKFVKLKEDTIVTRAYDIVTKRFAKQPILEEIRKNNDVLL